MTDKNIEKEIEEIKIRLNKIEKHVNSCDEHDEKEGHDKGHGKAQHEHQKKH